MFLYVFDFALVVCSSILCLTLCQLLPAPCVLHFPFVQCILTIFACCISVDLLVPWLLHSQSCCWLSWIVFYLLVVPRYVAFCHVSLVVPPLEVIASFRDCLIVFCFQLVDSPLEVIASFCNRLIVFCFQLVDSPLEVIASFRDHLIVFHFRLSVGCDLSKHFSISSSITRFSIPLALEFKLLNSCICASCAERPVLNP